MPAAQSIRCSALQVAGQDAPRCSLQACNVPRRGAHALLALSKGGSDGRPPIPDEQSPCRAACRPPLQLTALTALSLVAKWRSLPTHLPDAFAALAGLRQLKLSHGLTQVLLLVAVCVWVCLLQGEGAGVASRSGSGGAFVQ